MEKWEGIGIASYLLIGFWITRREANKSAIKALTVNRVGDTILTIGIFTILWVIGSLDYGIIISIVPFVDENLITFIGFLLFGGAISKSAQVPLHGWLADNTYLIYLIFTYLLISIYIIYILIL